MKLDSNNHSYSRCITILVVKYRRKVTDDTISGYAKEIRMISGGSSSQQSVVNHSDFGFDELVLFFLQ
ncbi:hypothetical protein JOE23_000541 [Amphibacillus cookii]|nr:hypothetical protein [Amphibacillus cookii]